MLLAITVSEQPVAESFTANKISLQPNVVKFCETEPDELDGPNDGKKGGTVVGGNHQV